MNRELRQIYADLSSGKLSQQQALEKIRAAKHQRQQESLGTLLIAPGWQPDRAEASTVEYDQRHVILCELPAVDSAALCGACVSVPADSAKDLASRYSDVALACFERLQEILAAMPQGNVLVRVVAASDPENALLAGLSGLLQTATLENPRFIGQLVLVPAQTTTETLASWLALETDDPLVRYEDGTRQVLRWTEITVDSMKPALAFRDDGVYLITGGLGALGLLFAGEILARTSHARVVLTGRGELNGAVQAKLDELTAQPGRVSYRRVDLTDAQQVDGLIAGIEDRYTELTGILHCAGMTADNFILRKSADEFLSVLAPKVTGTVNLDRATRDLALDFFVLFSSFAGAMGNVGQADYATANAFLDQFAAYRNMQVAAGQRSGRTRSINWPLWQAGGMAIEPASLEVLQHATGLTLLQTANGMQAFHHALALAHDQVLVGEGDLTRMRRAFLDAPVAPVETPQPATPALQLDTATLTARAQDYLRRELSSSLKLPANVIDPEAALERYGIDSILAMTLTSQLEKTFGPLSKTLFFEYQTIAALAGYFVRSHAAKVAELFQPKAGDAAPAALLALARAKRAPRRASRHRVEARRPAERETEAIAIIGLSGRYPESVDVEAYWQNLREGKDCVTEVPKDRWDWRDYYTEDRTRAGHHYSKWGGFIEGVAEFDPLFFNISPKEAKFIDPQERLFLQHAWKAVEDAGYTRATLQVPVENDLPGQVGVYVGVMYSEYQLFGAESSIQGKRLGIAGSSASIANRVSYVLNLHGPSVTLDTMCSSSLTAIHFACLDLKLGRTNLAIAGGVNVTIHPNKYLVLSSGQFISSDGHCQSFGEGGDGYIPGEGVGAVVLKRLSEAERDGDHIYGIIRGSALNHGGKTNGITVPNPNAQATAIGRALAEAKTDARHVSYIEAHGTGTKLGDPIEIAALNKAFQQHTGATQFCLIGSAKSNIGHCESAAGIAGLTKILLQMQHREIVPSLHSAQLNPHIDFLNSPFTVNQTLQPWEQPVVDGRTLPRIAGISSFGAGGSNAHLVIEEYQAPARRPVTVDEVAVVLSARTPEQLQEKVRELLDFVRPRVDDLDLPAVAWTLQSGREAMDERLGFVAGSAAQLVEKLEAYLAGEQNVEDMYQGQVKRNREALAMFSTDSDLKETIGKWIAGRKLAKLLDLWVKGLDLDWGALYDAQPQRVSLPTYPFARERYWIETAAVETVSAAAPTTAVLHPLLHTNTSDLTQQSYSSTFTGDELFVTEQKTVAPAALLEMARAAVVDATRGSRDAGVELRDVVWGEPAPAAQIEVALFDDEAGQLEFEIYSNDGQQELVHCQGRALSSVTTVVALDIESLERRGERLARLRLPDGVAEADYVLHPTLLEGALRAAATANDATASPRAIGSLRVIAPCTREMVAWVRTASGSQELDIDLCDVRGEVCAQLRGVSFQQASLDVLHAGDQPAEPATAAVDGEVVRPALARNELVLGAGALPVEKKRRAAVALTAPGASASANTAPAGKARITLSNVATDASAANATPATPAVRLYDRENGIFGIELLASRSRDMIAQVLQALDRVQQAESLKVLMLSGIEHCFAYGDRDEYNDAVERKLFQRLVSFPYPVIAVLQGDVTGAGFLAAALCDFMVCNEEAQYGYTDAQSGFYPTVHDAALFSERFGAVLAGDFLYLSPASTGRELRAKGWMCPIVATDQLERHAEELASTFVTKSQDALRLLKQHLTRNLTPFVDALRPIVVPPVEKVGNPAGRTITSPSPNLQLDTPAEQVLVVRYGAMDVAALGALFATIREGGYYKAVVLAGNDGPDVADDVVLELQRLIAAVEIPVIAASTGNASGAAWLMNLLCDACVHGAASVYSAADLAPSPLAAAAFTQRFGNVAGKEILLTGASWRGAELQQRVGALLVAESDRVVSTAVAVAEGWTKLPRITLASWKQSTAAAIAEKASGFAIDDVAEQITSEALPAAPATIALQSKVVSVTAHPEGIAVVKLEDRQARNMFSADFIAGVTEAFAHIEQSSAYKVVVVTGYDNYFAAGGTKETLLAIQDGTAKFTDVNIFQLPFACTLPVVAAIQGHALGAGWAMGMFADVIVMSEESRYVSPYMKYGFTPGAGATWILAHKIGEDLTRESLFTAEYYTGHELRQRGLRVPILPRAEVLPAAMQLAKGIARSTRGRLVALKQQFTRSLRETLADTYRRELAMHEQTFVGQTDTLAKIRLNFYGEIESRQAGEPATQYVPRPRTAGPVVVPIAVVPVTDPLAAVTATLRTLLATELQMRENDIDGDAQFVDIGLDSISGVSWIRRINEKYQTSIEATKVYSFPTLEQLAEHVKEEAEKQGTLPVSAAPVAVALVVVKGTVPRTPVAAKLVSRRVFKPSRFAEASATTEAVVPVRARGAPEPIAVIGVAGQFPQAKNVDEFWQNIAGGKDCITRVSSERWDLNTFYQAGDVVPGKTNSEWFGALEEYDLFDPLFFNISPTEALSMDPQQRLFLQTCWQGIEDAGYDPRSLSGSKCGVFVGAASGDYHQLSREHALSAQGFTGAAMSILAARISYFLNLRGPSITLDTACSSSLVAIANACESLNSGGSDVALAGGVYVMSGPDMHIMTSQAAMLSPDGKCYTFDQRANGFVPGEGVGVVVLKRLSDAERDGDTIQGVIQGWGINQDGKTNGITAPNPESQTRLEQDVYDRFDIDPEYIQLVEAHGTGTKLGDPIEVEGLKQAFRKYTRKTGYCAIGSVKSNIGHTLTAAGIAGVLKLVLAIRNRQLPPTIHFEKLNEHIYLEDSPFFVNSELREWKRNGVPRQAAISSFGFSGTNVHMVISEYERASDVVRPLFVDPVIVPLSARTPEQLEQKVRDLLAFVCTDTPSVVLSDVAWTLQSGRQAMDERLGFVASSVDQLAAKLETWLAGEGEEAHRGQVKRGQSKLAVLGQDADLLKTVVDKCVADNKLSTLLELWINGVELDWSRLDGDATPRRVSLPVYPFAKDRYWLDAEPVPPAGVLLHPLVHSNTSDLARQRYTSIFNGDEPFLADLAGGKVLPAAACLEMARAAVERALPQPSASTVIELRNTVWAMPIVITSGKEINIALSALDDEQIDFDIYSRDVVHCQGRAVVSHEPPPAPLDLARLAAEGETLIHLAAAVRPSNYVLDLTVVESALQAALAGIAGATPSALARLRIAAPCTATMVAWVRTASGSFDVDLCDTDGNVCVELRGLSWHVLGSDTGTVTATPVWQASADRGKLEYSERHVILCDLTDLETLPFADCLPLGGKQENIAQRFSDYALACFQRIRTILRRKPQGKVLVQVVVADDREQVLLSGLSGLLKTAALENPHLAGQLILVPPRITGEALTALLEAERSPEAMVRYDGDVRQVRRWQEVEAEQSEPPVAFKDGGVYLITGGLGALGLLFAKEILERTSGSKVVLTGRSANGESAARELGYGDRVSYRRLDLGDLDQVRGVIRGVTSELGQLDGILHCAGMIADNFIVRKGRAEFSDVLTPKVTGTYNLDQATLDVPLDFFALFSSIAGALGNPGQADYASANAFMDQFAAYRNALVDGGERHGRTRSVNWPLWEHGGMALAETGRELVLLTIGAQPLQTATGLQAFHRSLAQPYPDVVVVEGIRSKIRAYLHQPRVLEDSPSAGSAASARKTAAASVQQLQRELKAIVAQVLRIDASVIDAEQPFAEFGLDSFLGAEMILLVNKQYGTDLSHARLFDYATVTEFARFLEQELGKLPAQAVKAAEPVETTPVTAAGSAPLLEMTVTDGRKGASRDGDCLDDKVAIVGMSGRYPQANDLSEYWQNLAEGRNAITEVPASRWDVDRYYDADRTKKDKTYSKWLGAIDDIDRFDPLFFRISPQEAEYMDPQHRLFLQESYRAFEDAGYSTVTLSNQKCGVYLGISNNEYMTLLSRAGAESAPVTSNSYAIAAARIAYYLNLKGPAISIDTACSSSLVATHLACQALLSGEIDMALAGGVSLWLIPDSYVAMSKAGMFSPDGQCKTFDDSADGIVNGEGVGAVVLKRLKDAEADGDVIYGVILGSGINQDGRTNGITAPSVNSQIELERSVYAKHEIDPDTITHVEAHGTGTKLGDPIELEALAASFKERTSRRNFCSLGSVKSNIGHTTSAAGVASLHKVLLSMRHRMRVPSLNVTKETTRFDFAGSPFFVNRETAAWDVAPGTLRRAAVSSFGFSGTNAHLVVEEYASPVRLAAPVSGPVIVPLSARSPEQLRQRAVDLLHFLRTAEQPFELAGVAWTLQAGREAMEERLALVVSSLDQLTGKLAAYVEGERDIDGVARGRVEPGSDNMTLFDGDDDMQETVEKWIALRKLPTLADSWARGLTFDWNKLYDGAKPRRVSLPTYPFLKERCWIDVPVTVDRNDQLPAGPETGSIEDILGQIADDSMETADAVQALRTLV